MTPRSWSLALALLAGGLAACAEDDTGISVAVACDTFCDRFVECTVEEAVNEDNAYAQCMTSCEDEVGSVEDQNPGDNACSQASREYYRCLGAEASCPEFEAQMFEQETCLGEILDVVEFCEAGTY